ncbi:MAG: hypothetical protein KA748_01665 [Halomonas sp.]|nr:hypothetical protein [Halomonas sp.]MBP5978895.1 hypothetical protein [Halomonas sp.]
MQHIHLAEISQAGLQLAIQEIKDEMFDTPECDYTIAKLLCHCSQFEAAERQLDDMLLKWGSSPDVVELTEKGYAMVATMSNSVATPALHSTAPQVTRQEMVAA